MTTAPGAKVFINPDAASWRGMLDSMGPPGDESRAFREQLGLPSAAPLILTGHQSTLWHPGILAKYIAAEAAARTVEGAVAWLVVDQDAQDFGALDIPVSDPGGRLSRQTLRLAPPPPMDAAAASCPAFDPLPPAAAPAQPAVDSIRPGLLAIAERLRKFRGQANAARQVGFAVAELIAELIPRRPTIFATDLTQTDLMKRLVERMCRAPKEMASAYNSAASEHPEARVAPLQVDGDRIELPLWRLRDGAPRARVWSDDAGLARIHDLAPRALLMTGMLRMAGCELFIHGRGGGIYDRITDAWLGAWLGATLAPTVVVSADLALPLGQTGVGPKEVATAKWRVHRALHDPEIVGDRDAAATKRAWLARIVEARAAGNDASPHYREMHRALEAFRLQRAGDIGALRDQAATLEREHANAAIAEARTWAFPLYERGALEGLRERIFAEFGLEVSRNTAPSMVSRPA